MITRIWLLGRLSRYGESLKRSAPGSISGAEACKPIILISFRALTGLRGLRQCASDVALMYDDTKGEFFSGKPDYWG